MRNRKSRQQETSTNSTKGETDMRKIIIKGFLLLILIGVIFHSMVGKGQSNSDHFRIGCIIENNDSSELCPYCSYLNDPFISTPFKDKYTLYICDNCGHLYFGNHNDEEKFPPEFIIID